LRRDPAEINEMVSKLPTTSQWLFILTGLTLTIFAAACGVLALV
jgi:hypothetical protein